MLKTATRVFNLRHMMWARIVLLCTVFSALHGLLGAWVVPAVASGPVAEICTPNGLQWVALDGAPADEHPADWPQGLAQPCAWASAHAAMTPGWEGGAAIVYPPPVIPLAAANGGAGPHLRGNAERVLLMAPMRAPPA